MFGLESIFGKKQETQKETKIELKREERVVKIITQKVKKNDAVYLVMHTDSQALLGIFDTLELAKKEGIKSTNNTCFITKFKLNESCKHLHTEVYRS